MYYYITLKSIFILAMSDIKCKVLCGPDDREKSNSSGHGRKFNTAKHGLLHYGRQAMFLNHISMNKNYLFSNKTQGPANLILARYPDGTSNWDSWNRAFLTQIMRYVDCYSWLTTGVKPAFETEGMEEWMWVEGHRELITRDEWRGITGETRWRSLERHNEARKRRFVSDASEIMALLSSTISPELLMVMQLDESFTQRWRDRDFVHVYRLAHQAAVNDFQLSAHADIMSLLRLEMVDDGYLEFCHEFNRIWEKLESDYPDPTELLDRILSGKVVSDCACTLSRLQGSVNEVLGSGEELPCHEDLMRKFGEELYKLEALDKADAVHSSWPRPTTATGNSISDGSGQCGGGNTSGVLLGQTLHGQGAAPPPFLVHVCALINTSCW